MDFAPYYEPGLVGPNGKLTRLHKGGAAPTPPVPVATPQKGTVATNVDMAKQRDPSRRVRGFQSTILTTGMNNNFGRRSILGG